MLFISWVALALLASVAIAKFFAQKYYTTAPPSGKILRAFRPASTPSAIRKATLSVVIPCYNEESRLPSMLHDCVEYARNVRSSRNDTSSMFSDVEIIVVDDCSTDRTVEVAKQVFTSVNLAAASPEETVLFSIVPSKPNHGKGYAVRTGFFAASGDMVLMADGDNATRFTDVDKLAKAIEDNSVDIAVGSRSHMEQESIASRTLGRTILMKLFHGVVAITYFIGTLGKPCRIRDTQCGFKLFRRRAAEKLFLNNRLERWAFDVELLILAQRFGMPVVEIPVNWQEIPGSKVRIQGMIQMGLECVLICFAYPFGLWTLMRTQGLF